MTVKIVDVYCLKMSDAEKYTDENNPTKWKARKENKVRKEEVIKTAKIRGEAHINHARKQVPARVTGPDCRYSYFLYFVSHFLSKIFNF